MSTRSRATPWFGPRRIPRPSPWHPSPSEVQANLDLDWRCLYQTCPLCQGSGQIQAEPPTGPSPLREAFATWWARPIDQ